MGRYEYRNTDPKLAYKHPDIKDFKKLNKVVLKEGATSAAANRQLRGAHNDIKVIQKTSRTSKNMGASVPDSTFGRANRPQTPINGIIMNNYGEESEANLQQKYAAWKQSVSSLCHVANLFVFESACHLQGSSRHPHDQCSNPR